MDFVAIDFETANSRRESACAVGLARFSAGELVDTFYSLLKPPVPFDDFSPYNVGIHGIQASDVSGSPSLGDAWPEIENFVSGDPIVAHNTDFDMSVIARQLSHEGRTFAPIRFACTLKLSKRLLNLPVNKLPYVASSLGLEMGNHHNALDDAVAAGRIFAHLVETYKGTDALLALAGMQWGELRPGFYHGTSLTPSTQGPSFQHHTEEEILEFRKQLGLGDLNPAAPLFGKQVAFTLKLQTMERDMARMAVEIEGGTWADKPNKTTDYLVIGETNLNVLLPGQAVTGKLAKAIQLKDSGSHIEIIDEQSFLELLTPRVN